VLCARALLLLSITHLALLALSEASAAPVQAIAIRQPEHGTVIVTMRTPGATPSVNAFTLQLFNADAAAASIPAQSVTPADSLSPELATSVLLAVDRSGSMQSVVPGIKSALKDVLSTPRPDLRIAVMSFGSDTPLPTPFYTDPAKITQAVGEIRAETGHDGKTRLYDAISMGMSYLANDPSQGPKRLIVITDGKDEGSRTTFEGLAGQLKARPQALDAIASGQPTQRSSSQLQQLSSDTNGLFAQASGAGRLAASIRDDLGTAPAPAFDVRFHYPAAADAPPVRNAQIEFANPGAPAMVIPVRVALAAPAAPAAPPPSHAPDIVPAALPEAHATAASEPTIGGANTESGTHRPYVSIGSIRIDLRIVLSALLALLGVGATRLVYVVVIRSRGEKAPEKGAESTPSAPPVLRQSTQVGVMFPPPSPGRPSALLVSEGPRRAPLSYAIEKANVRIGGDGGSDLVVHDDYVSRKHANIRFESGSLYLTDLGSSNGTFLNGARIRKVMVLSPGDQIRFGHSTWEVRRPGEASFAGRASEPFERPVP
jgi:Mg-chelatase subunit ChlD